MVEESNLTLVVVTVMKRDRKPSTDETKHNVLSAQRVSFPNELQDIVQNSSSEIISGADFPKVVFIVF